MADPLPRSFIRAVEVWRPDGDLLQRDSGAYGTLRAFEEASLELTLRKGQGLPGGCWSTMRPEVWHELGARFLRAAPARTAGIGAAVALPVFRGNELVAVVAFYCGAREDSEGCIEVWESNGKGVLEHADGYYGKLIAFEAASRKCTFRRGVGLPGLVFQHGMPRIVDDLKKSNSFVRAAAARESGVASGLGIPLFCGDVIQQVVLFLSADAMPLARAFEIWKPERGGELRRAQGFYSPELSAFGRAREQVSASDGSFAQRVRASALPLAVSTETRAFPELDEVRAAGADIVVGLPVHDGGSLRAVVLIFT